MTDNIYINGSSCLLGCMFLRIFDRVLNWYRSWNIGLVRRKASIVP